MGASEPVCLKTHMHGACLKNADLRGVDLSEADGLTIEQLQQAIIDRHTKLPDELSVQSLTRNRELRQAP